LQTHDCVLFCRMQTYLMCLSPGCGKHLIQGKKPTSFTLTMQSWLVLVSGQRGVIATAGVV
jgi:hypothetical protein